MFINLADALLALISFFESNEGKIANLPAVTVQDNIFYVDLSPNPGYLVVDTENKKAYRVSQIGNKETLDSHCTPEYLAYILKCIEEALTIQSLQKMITSS